MPTPCPAAEEKPDTISKDIKDTVCLADRSRHDRIDCHVPLLASANVPSLTAPGKAVGSPSGMTRHQPWSPHRTVSTAAGSPPPSRRKPWREQRSLSCLIFALPAFHFHRTGLEEFCGTSFPGANLERHGAIPSTGRALPITGKFCEAQGIFFWHRTQNKIKILQEFLGEGTFGSLSSGCTGKRTHNSTKSMTTGNEDTPARLIRKGSRKPDLKSNMPITSMTAQNRVQTRVGNSGVE